MSKVTDRDKGAKALKARMKKFHGMTLTVGIHSDVGGEAKEGTTTGETLLEVATANEFGTEQIPERSFIRDWFDLNEDKSAKVLKLEAERVVKGADPKEALSRAGVFFRGQIQQRIADGIEPENADSTIDRKGSSTPLIDTGQLRASIESRVA